MPDRVIKVVNDWGQRHAKENIKHSLTFLNCKKQIYNWDNDNLLDEEGLMKNPESHPKLPAKFPDIELESKQPHHHYVVKALKASNDENVDAAICNASLDNLPCNTTGVLMAGDKIEINNWIEQQQTCKDPYHDLPALSTVAIQPKATPAIVPNIPTPAVATDAEDEDLGSIIIGGIPCSARAPTPHFHTKVDFDSKSYPDGKYRDGTIHIAMGIGHDANHPSPIDPKPLMHILVTDMMHYANPDARALTFAQVYSFKVGLKRFGEVRSKAVVTKLTQLHDYHIYNPVQANSLTPAKQKMVLELLMNIVDKRNGQVRIHAIADGSKEWHQLRYKKEDGTSSTIATDSIMITATIDAHERQDIATVNIPGAFLHAYNDKDTFMLLRRRLTKLMVQVDPTLYRKCIIYGKK
jgi:hypothetical protein